MKKDNRRKVKLPPLPSRKDTVLDNINKPPQKKGVSNRNLNLPKHLDEGLLAKQKNELPIILDPPEKKKRYIIRFWKRKKQIVPSVKEKDKKAKLGFWNKRKLKKKPASSFLIYMHFSNGTSKEFVIATRKETFRYMKRTYYLRYEDSWFNITQNQYVLHYFDDHPVPLNREIIKQGDKAYWTVTSDNLKPLIEMEYVKALASSADIDKYLKMNATLSVFLIFMMIFVLFMLFRISKAISLL